MMLKWKCQQCESVLVFRKCPPQVTCKNNHVDKSPQCEQQPSLGLGDTIAKITSAVGIKPCGGCKQRQALLNRLFPYKDA